jgi:hypothetical protein
MSAESAVINKNSVIRQLNNETGSPRDTVTQLTTSLNSMVMAKSFGPDIEGDINWNNATNTGTMPPPIKDTEEPATTDSNGKKSSGSRRLILLMLYITAASFLLFVVLAKAKVIKF